MPKVMSEYDKLCQQKESLMVQIEKLKQTCSKIEHDKESAVQYIRDWHDAFFSNRQKNMEAGSTFWKFREAYQRQMELYLEEFKDAKQYRQSLMTQCDCVQQRTRAKLKKYEKQLYTDALLLKFQNWNSIMDEIKQEENVDSRWIQMYIDQCIVRISMDSD